MKSIHVKLLLFLACLTLFSLPKIFRVQAATATNCTNARTSNDWCSGAAECGQGGCKACEQCVQTCWGILFCAIDKTWRCQATYRCKFGIPAVADPNYVGPKISDLEGLLIPIAKVLYYGGLFIGVCFIVYSGYTLATSEGNPQAVQTGKEQLTSAIVGIFFILLSSAILRVIINQVIGGNAGI